MNAYTVALLAHDNSVLSTVVVTGGFLQASLSTALDTRIDAWGARVTHVNGKVFDPTAPLLALLSPSAPSGKFHTLI